MPDPGDHPGPLRHDPARGHRPQGDQRQEVSYSLSEAATVSFKLEKKSKGRKVGKKCVKQTKKNKTKKACPLFKQVASFSGPGNVGANNASIPKKLGPGQLPADDDRP